MATEGSGSGGGAVNGDLNDFSFNTVNTSEDPINVYVNNFVLQSIQQRPFDMDTGVAEKIITLGPIGLRLHKSPELLNSFGIAMNQEGSGRSRSSSTPDSDHRAAGTGQRNENMPQPEEKLKASNFSASYLKIGDWDVKSKNQGDLVVKIYFSKRRLVWEILDTEQRLKRKIEMQWSDISAIRASFVEDKHGMLEVELSQPPTFFQEQDPQPRKHTLWSATTDFTGGQAPIHRRHCLICPKGTLEKPYEKLLQADMRLYQLDKMPFPSSAHPYFITDPLYNFYLNLDSPIALSLSMSKPMPMPPLLFPSPSSYQQQQQQRPLISTLPYFPHLPYHNNGISSNNNYTSVADQILNQTQLGYWSQQGAQFNTSSNNNVAVNVMRDHQIQRPQVQQQPTMLLNHQGFSSSQPITHPDNNEAMFTDFNSQMLGMGMSQQNGYYINNYMERVMNQNQMIQNQNQGVGANGNGSTRHMNQMILNQMIQNQSQGAGANGIDSRHMNQMIQNQMIQNQSQGAGANGKDSRHMNQNQMIQNQSQGLGANGNNSRHMIQNQMIQNQSQGAGANGKDSRHMNQNQMNQNQLIQNQMIQNQSQGVGANGNDSSHMNQNQMIQNQSQCAGANGKDSRHMNQNQNQMIQNQSQGAGTNDNGSRHMDQNQNQGTGANGEMYSQPNPQSDTNDGQLLDITRNNLLPRSYVQDLAKANNGFGNGAG